MPVLPSYTNQLYRNHVKTILHEITMEEFRLYCILYGHLHGKNLFLLRKKSVSWEVG